MDKDSGWHSLRESKYSLCLPTGVILIFDARINRLNAYGLLPIWRFLDFARNDGAESTVFRLFCHTPIRPAPLFISWEIGYSVLVNGILPVSDE